VSPDITVRDNPEAADETIRSITELFAGLVGGIAKIAATRSQTIQPSSDKELPPVLPHQLVNVRTSTVCVLVSRHRQRLEEAGWTDEEIAQVETDHQKLLLAIGLDTSAECGSDQHPADASVR
jgi:hypothetical protein